MASASRARAGETARPAGPFSPVSVDTPGLTVRTCLYGKDPTRMLVGLFNNHLFADWEGTLRVRHGMVASAREMWHGKALAPTAEGGVPLAIPAGDVAMVEVRLR